MALSGNQVTIHGISGYSQIPYGSFAGKSLQALFPDITGIVSFTSFAPARKYTDLTGTKSFTDHSPKRKFDEL